jgi:acyl-CoA reductase-like NAD-dependent aldehyde dehydrogenase
MPMPLVQEEEQVRRFVNIVGGKKIAAASGNWMPSLDPYRNENWCEIPDSGPQDVDAAAEADALRIANNSKYGLAAGVWTKDMGRAFRMSKGLQSATVWVNTYRALSFMAPFGGVKDSGLGRESGREMINSYVQPKTVWLNNSAESPQNPFIMRLT